MNSENRQCFFLTLDTGVSTAFLVHPVILVAARHSIVGATQGRVLAKDGGHVANIAGIYSFDNLSEIDIAFIEIKKPLSYAQLSLSTKKLRLGDAIQVHGYPEVSEYKLTLVSARVRKILDDEILYDFPKKCITNHTSLNGASGAPVFKTRAREVSAVHSGSYISEPVEALPITGSAIPSPIVYELLRSFVGNNLGK